MIGTRMLLWSCSTHDTEFEELDLEMAFSYMHGVSFPTACNPICKDCATKISNGI